MPVYERELPLYRIHYYNDFVYKVVKFKRSSMPSVHVTPEESREDPDGKFSQSYSRAKNILLQLALCNKWDYFITVTLDERLHNRYDINGAMSALVRWMIEYRREYKTNVKYVFIPEFHKKGGVHFHGFISGVRPDHLTAFVRGLHPLRLVDGDYFNFGLLAKDFGFVSLCPVKNPIGAAFYMTKYITKEMARSGYYEHLYAPSRGLNRSRPTADCYAYNSVLESYLQSESDFCCTGWAIGGSIDWTFPFSIDHAEIIVDDYLSSQQMELLAQDVPGFAEIDDDTPFPRYVDLCVTSFGEVFEGVQLAIEEYFSQACF